MNKNTKRVLGVVAAATLVAGSIAITSAQAAVKSVTLVYQGPLTGTDAQTGQDEFLGAQTAVQIYNDSNPAVTVKLITADDQGDGAVAGTVAPGIAQNKSVIGVVGPAYSGASIASFPSYKAGRLTMVSPSATRVTLTDPKSADNGYPFFHRVVGNDALQGPAVVRWSTDGVSSPKVYVIDDQTPYGTGLADAANAYIKLKKITKVGSDSVVQKTSDYTATVSKIKASKANVVIYTGYYPDGGALAKALNDSGWVGTFAGGDGVLNDAFIGVAGKAAAEGVKFTAPAVPFETAASDAQQAAFTKATKLKTAAGHVYVTETFNATNVFLTCIKQGKYSRAGIQACVATGTFYGLDGKTVLRFTRFGEVVGGAPVGGFQVVKGVIKYFGAV
ncbi:MAG: branched-chain amino acid ABC transporter substrate-binding protein [Actinomycetes bacterium]